MLARSFPLLLVLLSLACGDQPGDSSDASTSSSGVDAGTEAGETEAGETGTSETGEQADASCEADANADVPTPATTVDPEHVHTVTGNNGSFTDMCDADGNLVEYVCEVLSMCDEPPNPVCTYTQSGDVMPSMFDCAGTCMNGTCAARCPAIGDVVEYTSVGVDTIDLHNQSDGRNYTCVVVYDNANDAWDCLANPVVGATTDVTSLGLQSTWCTGTQGFNIGTGEPEQCAYACTIVP